jgi:methionyl-tRNA synthetase
MSFYLTTPIYYVNSTPHIGHAYTTIAGDILVRHHRQRGERTFYLTGVDEHADKVARVAAAQGLAPQEYADRIVVAWQELPERVNASIDFFIRTSDEGHKQFVQEFLQRIHDNGDVYQDVYAGLYCVGCEAFKTEDELVDGKCPDHGVEPEWLEEKNWFFRLSAYQDRLLRLFEERPDFVRPSFRANEAKGFIAGGLRDFSISRATQTWGVPIPWDPDQVAYVWADALVNYRSALEYARPGEDLTPLWADVRHLIGKDILRFHCVYWPALLLSAGYDVPRQIFVHGYLNIDERKISKSLGNVIDPLDLVSLYGADPVRFWAARVVPFGQDGNVTLESFHERYERELGNDLGNLLSRTTAMIARYRDGELRAAPDPAAELARAAQTVHDQVPVALDGFDITGALETIWAYVRRLNKHVEDSKPWVLAKDEAQADELDRVLYDLADGLRVAAVALAAYVPDTAVRILETLKQPADDHAWDNVAYGATVAASGIEAAEPLFPRIDAPAPAA